MPPTLDALRAGASISEERLLAVLALEAVTPILIGGYDARTHHSSLEARETLRPTSVKSVWRWWARSLLATAYYNRCGKFLDLSEADKLASRLLGSTGEASKHEIHVEKEGVTNTYPG